MRGRKVWKPGCQKAIFLYTPNCCDINSKWVDDYVISIPYIGDGIGWDMLRLCQKIKSLIFGSYCRYRRFSCLLCMLEVSGIVTKSSEARLICDHCSNLLDLLWLVQKFFDLTNQYFRALFDYKMPRLRHRNQFRIRNFLMKGMRLLYRYPFILLAP